MRGYDVDSDDATISFEYAVTADGWWERPDVRIYDREAKIYDSGEDDDRGFERTAHGTTDTFRVTVSPRSAVEVALGLGPSRHCSNSDHAKRERRGTYSRRTERVDEECHRRGIETGLTSRLADRRSPVISADVIQCMRR